MEFITENWSWISVALMFATGGSAWWIGGKTGLRAAGELIELIDQSKEPNEKFQERAKAQGKKLARKLIEDRLPLKRVD